MVLSVDASPVYAATVVGPSAATMAVVATAELAVVAIVVAFFLAVTVIRQRGSTRGHVEERKDARARDTERLLRCRELRDAAGVSVKDRLDEVDRRHATGTLTPEEWAQARARILGV